MKIQNKLPQCCGLDMTVTMETILYTELRCGKCHDMIYVKKSDMPKPQMLDD